MKDIKEVTKEVRYITKRIASANVRMIRYRKGNDIITVNWDVNLNNSKLREQLAKELEAKCSDIVSENKHITIFFK